MTIIYKIIITEIFMMFEEREPEEYAAKHPQ